MSSGAAFQGLELLDLKTILLPCSASAVNPEAVDECKLKEVPSETVPSDKLWSLALIFQVIPDVEYPKSCCVIILNSLVTVLLFAVAVTVNVEVVSPDTFVGSPEITPVDEFKLVPAGIEPAVTV